jgi:glutamine synthetase
MSLVPAPREYIRYEIVDFHCKALSKTVPARHRNASFCMYSGALAMGANSEVLMFPEEITEAGCPDGQLRPDWSTEQELPWASSPERGILVRRVYCEQACGASSEDPLKQVAPRTVCKRLLQELRDFKGRGFELFCGGELEFTLAKASGGGALAWAPFFDGVDIFATLQNSKAMDFCYEVERQMEPVGVDILTMNTEYGAGQLEITFAPKFGVESADMTATFRTGTKEIAQKQGLRASFMAKPFGVRGVGNGGHFNFSLWTSSGGAAEADQNGDFVTRATAGRVNAFHSAEDPDGLSPEARAFLAGVLAHAPAMEALCAPTVPCYCRHGNWAPVVGNWGLQDRMACVRVKANKAGKPGGCYMELRLPSASANPYLVLAAVTAAGLDGMQKSLELPPARQTKEQGAPVIPTNLEEALSALEADKYMVEKLGADFVRWFCLVKRGELKKVNEMLDKLEEPRPDEGVTAVWQHMYMEYI